MQRKTKNSKKSFKDERSDETIRVIPDPITGLVSARAWTQFPDIQLVTDRDVQQSIERAIQRSNEQQVSERNQSAATGDSGQSSSRELGSVLKGLLKQRN